MADDNEPATVDYAEIYRRVSPSVVSIEVELGLLDDASGTGFLVDENGHIVTNAHVVEDARRIRVLFHDGSQVPADLVGLDLWTDIAVIKVNVARHLLKPVTYGDSDSLAIGQAVLAIGNPYGLEATLTTGIISGLKRELEFDDGSVLAGMIQTDAAIAPGSSGGPLLNLYGEVIGVNSAGYGARFGGTNFGFAIPSNTVRRMSDLMIVQGSSPIIVVSAPTPAPTFTPLGQNLFSPPTATPAEPESRAIAPAFVIEPEGALDKGIIVWGEDTPNEIENADQRHSYRLDGIAGATVEIKLITVSGTGFYAPLMTLYDPDGNIVFYFDRARRSNRGSFTFPAAGPYQIVIGPDDRERGVDVYTITIYGVTPVPTDTPTATDIPTDTPVPTDTQGVFTPYENGISLNVIGLDSTDLTHVRINASVLDSSGQLVSGLENENFSIGGDLAGLAEVTGVENVTDDDLDFASVLVIDTSSSMADRPLRQAQAAVRSYLEALGEDDPVAVVSFSNKARLALDYTIDRERLIKAIDNLAYGGKTALYDATLLGIETAIEAPLERKAVVILSDGGQYGDSRHSREDAIRAAAAYGIPVYTVGLGWHIDSRFLKTIARESNAEFYDSLEPEELGAIYRNLAFLFRSQYIVSLSVDVPADVQRYDFTLNVITDDGRRASGGAMLRAPFSGHGQQYTPPPTPTPKVLCRAVVLSINAINVRARPTTRAGTPIVGYLPTGTVVSILKQQREAGSPGGEVWYFVNVAVAEGAISGWIRNNTVVPDRAQPCPPVSD